MTVSATMSVAAVVKLPSTTGVPAARTRWTLKVTLLVAWWVTVL